jgi:formylglycine-generating enzyme required for sulfatase activity
MQLRLMLMMVTAVFATGLSSTDELMAQSEKEITNSIGMKLVLIPKGTFQMGSPVSEEGHGPNEVQHEVTLSKDFYLGVTEVIQAQYQKIIGENASYFQGDEVQGDSSNHPVENVSWDDAVEFCNRLSDLPEEKKAGRVYRLPTEAEWEYACRAGSETAYSFGASSKSLGDYAWFGNNSGSKELDSDALWAKVKNNPQEYVDTLLSAGYATHPVGEKKPNAWGLYDMHGNVFEWCSDWYGDYPKGAVSDPAGPRVGALRVRCGGGWGGEAASFRSASRRGSLPSDRGYSIGFRVALSSPEVPK